ncbi:MAG: response regulator [bacterium]
MTGGGAAAATPSLAQGLAAVFAIELEEQLRAALAIWSRTGAAATRAEGCRDLARIFHTIKGGAALAERAELAAAARAMERFFADPDAASAPAQAEVDVLFRAASLAAPRLEPLWRAVLAPASDARISEVLVPMSVGQEWLALPLRAVARALLTAAPISGLVQVAPGVAELTPYYLADVLDAPRPQASCVVLALADGAALVVDRVRPPLRLPVEPLHRLLSLHPWLGGVAVAAPSAPLLVVDPTRLLSVLAGAASLFEPETGRAGSAASVLVVDDSLVAREAAASVLRAAGIPVELARDGREALAKLERSAYAVVLSDLEMPQLDGFELIECLRMSRDRSQQPVVVCSSRLDPEARHRLEPLGVAGFVAKPFAAADLLAALRPWLPAALCPTL